MDARPSSHKPRLLHRVFRTRLAPSLPGEPVRVARHVADACWYGLVGAWLELGAVLGHRVLIGNVTRVSHRMNWYHAQLGVISHLVLMLPWMIAAWLLLRNKASSPRTEANLARSGLFLTWLSPLLAIGELHWAGSVVLAAGFAMRLGPVLALHRGIIRRTLPISAIASLVLLGGGMAWLRSKEARALAALPAAKPEAPNIGLIVLDTVRADHLSLHGYHRATTPRLEELAKRSIVFDFARSAAPWTLPSHATMFTGRWPHSLSADSEQPLDSTYPTIAEELLRSGYKTAGFTGNTFYTNAWFGIDRGFAHYEDMVENQELSVQEMLRSSALFRRLMPIIAKRLGLFARTGDEARRKSADEVRRGAVFWLDEQKSDRPYFLFVNFFDAHDPYEIPPGHEAQFSKVSRSELLRANRLYFEDAVKKKHTERSADSQAIVIDAYDDAIRYLDDQLARLVAELNERSQGRETWIFITSDHGEFFGEHGQFVHGSSLYRPGIDVPLVVIPPQTRATHRRVSAPVSLRDLPATLVELADLDARFPGRSLRRFWDGTQSVDSGDGDAPISELKLPLDHFQGRKVAPIDRYQAAIVDDGQILYENRTSPDEAYKTSDRAEVEDLLKRPSETPGLKRLRARLANELGSSRGK